MFILWDTKDLIAFNDFHSIIVIFFELCYVQIEAYRDMITPVVDAFKYLTQVCTCFCIFLSFVFAESISDALICDLIISSKTWNLYSICGNYVPLVSI